jgi:hypothetical protein
MSRERERERLTIIDNCCDFLSFVSVSVHPKKKKKKKKLTHGKL